MPLIAELSFRNLSRQKRRSAFLGLAMGIGMAALVLVTSFVSGITDLIMNKLMVYAAGHIAVSMNERQPNRTIIFRDAERFRSIIANEIGEDQIFSFAEGNMLSGTAKGVKNTNPLMLVGVDISPEFFSAGAMTAIEGDFADMTNGKFDTPILLGVDQAKSLGVKAGDTLPLSFFTIYGQQETVTLGIAALVKGANPMMTMANYANAAHVKTLRQYKTYEAGGYQVILKKAGNAREVAEIANRVYDAINPNLLGYYGAFNGASGRTKSGVAFGYYTNEEFTNALGENIRIVTGSLSNATDNKNRDAIMLSKALADAIGARVGAKVSSVYTNKFGGARTTNMYTVYAVYDPNGALPEYGALINPDVMIREDKIFEYLPEYIWEMDAVALPSEDAPIYRALISEFKKLPRTATTAETEQKQRDLKRENPPHPTLDVSTLYETFEFVNTFGAVVIAIGVIAVGVVFLVVLIGVLNTLRMTIRERTREIGTMRAIGIQARDVKKMFVYETAYLALFAAIAGTLFAFLLMFALSSIPINADSWFAILLYNGRLYFRTPVISVIIYFVVIIGISSFVAYFPSNRASKISPAEALRHYE